jgi:heme-degrading monooxygenase HmoA
MAAYLYVWQYRVRPGYEASFLDAYGPEGAWVQLFRRAEGFLRTELHRDREQPDRFVTLDYWESQEAWQAFRSSFAAEYQALDARCAAFTFSEHEIGRFEPAR